MVKPKNIIIQWESPQVSIKKEYKYLGVIKANPVEYVNRYGESLTRSSQLPQFVREIANPRGLVLAADLAAEEQQESHELYGDVHALALVDLEREGIGEYREQLTRMGVRTVTNVATNTTTANTTANTTPLNRSLSTAAILNGSSASGLNNGNHCHSTQKQCNYQHVQTQMLPTRVNYHQQQPVYEYVQNRPHRQRVAVSSASKLANSSTSINNQSSQTLVTASNTSNCITTTNISGLG